MGLSLLSSVTTTYIRHIYTYVYSCMRVYKPYMRHIYIYAYAHINVYVSDRRSEGRGSSTHRQKRPTTVSKETYYRGSSTHRQQSLFLSLTHALSHSHTHIHTHSLCVSLSVSHSLTHSHSLSLSLSLSLSHTHTHSLLSPSLPLSTTRGPGAFSDENRIQLLFVPCEVPCLALRVQGSGFR